MSVLLIFLLGLLVGKWAAFSATVIDRLTHASIAVVMLLLFVLGVSIGRNDAVFLRLGDLGLVAAGVAWSCILGSGAVAGIAHRWRSRRVE